MKHLKGFNEAIKRKDINELINEILDSLNKNSKLSKSEKEFMDEASKGTIKDISTPNPSGNFYSDIADPHNSSIMWIGKDNIWKQILSIEEEREDEIYSNKEKNRKLEIKQHQEKFLKEIPELKEALLGLAELQVDYSKKRGKHLKRLREFENKIKDKNLRYEFKNKIDYAIKGIDSLLNQFGYILEPDVYQDGNGEVHIKK